MISKASQKQQEILARRSRILELQSKGMSEREMSKRLDIPKSTINMDIRILRRKALTDIQAFDERIPYEYESMLTGIKQLLQKAWSVLEDAHSTERMIAMAMHTILTCYQQKRELLADMSNIQEVLEYRHRRDESRHHMMLEDNSNRNNQRVQAIQSGNPNPEAIF